MAWLFSAVTATANDDKIEMLVSEMGIRDRNSKA